MGDELLSGAVSPGLFLLRGGGNDVRLLDLDVIIVIVVNISYPYLFA